VRLRDRPVRIMAATVLGIIVFSTVLLRSRIAITR